MKRELPPKDIIEAYKQLPPANVSDCMGRLSALSPEIRLMCKPFKGCMAGPALTVKARSGDNLMIHKALDMAQEGDVVIISNSGDRSRALYGDILHGYAKFKKIGGIVFDGPIRDIDSIYDMGVPIYATGTTPGGPFKDGPGEINVPIACGGIHINPGDIVLGDGDGVIIIPRQDAAALLPIAQKFSASDHEKGQAALQGKADRSWVDKALAEKGCEIINDMWK